MRACGEFRLAGGSLGQAAGATDAYARPLTPGATEALLAHPARARQWLSGRPIGNAARVVSRVAT